MRYILIAVPEGSQDGAVIAELPEGTHSLDIQAYWGTVDADGKFRGGSAGFKAEKQEWEVRGGMADPLPAVHLVHPHETEVRSRILDGGKLREITGTSRGQRAPDVLNVHTRWHGRSKVIKLKPGDLAAVTSPYQ
jgi:hypothetical protein